MCSNDLKLPIRAAPYKHQREAATFALDRLERSGGATLLMERRSTNAAPCRCRRCMPACGFCPRPSLRCRCISISQYNAAGGKEKTLRHPLYSLLHDEPNPEMTAFSFRETLMTHLLLWDNGYAQIMRNQRGDVIALYPLMPDRMSVDRDGRGRKKVPADLDDFDLEDEEEYLTEDEQEETE